MHASTRSCYNEIIRFPIEHLRVLGPPGSGKTTALLERYRFLNEEGTAGTDGIAIVTYTRESAERLTAAVLPEMSQRRRGEPVFRYFDLAKDVLSAAGVAMRTIGRMEELVLLDRIASSLAEGGRSGDPSALCSENFRRILLALIRSLMQNGVSPEEARVILRAPGLDGRLAGVPDIYEAFRDTLRRERFTTEYDICWRAAEALQNHPDANPLVDTRLLLIDDFQDVDPGQYALLSLLAPHSGPVKVNVFGDPTAAHFRFKGTQHRFLMDTFPGRYGGRTFHLPAASAGPGLLGGAVLSLLEATLGEDAGRCLPVVPLQGTANTNGGLQEERKEGTTEFDVSFDVRPDEFNEALHVAERVKALLAGGRHRPRDIAVAAREKHRYEFLLSAAFQYYGIPFESGRSARSAVENFVVDVLTLLCSPEDEAASASLIASPFYIKLRRENGSAAEDEETHTGNSAAPESPGSLLDVMRKKLFAEPAEDVMASLLREFILPAVRAGDGYGEGTGSENDNGGGEDGIAGPSPSVYAYFSSLLAEWGRFTAATGAPLQGSGPALVRGFLDKCTLFEDSFAPLVPVPGRVGFYSCHELKGRTFPAVFLVGCAEMLFPTAKAEEAVVPYDVLQHACDELFPERGVEFYAARSDESHLRDELSLLLLALSRASETLFISAPLRYGGELETVPTALVFESLPEEVRGETASPDEVSRILPPAARWADHLVHADGEAAARLGDRLRRGAAGASPVPLLWNAAPLGDRSVKAPRRRISQSSLRAFDACPRRYFYSRVLRLPEEDSLAMRFGSFFHEVMKELAAAFPNKERMHGAGAKARAGTIIEETLERRRNPQDSPMVERSMRHYLNQMVERFFELDALRSDDYTIRRVESSLLFHYAGVDFVGIIDRQDSSQQGRQVVIDYKTGKIKKTGDGIRKNILESAEKPEERDWQVPIYVYGVMSEGTAPPLVFSYYDIQPGEEPFVVSLFIDDAGRDADPDSLFAGSPKKRFGVLGTDEVKACMDDAVRLAEIIFAPTPFFARTEDESRCRFCSYRTVCRRGEGWS